MYSFYDVLVVIWGCVLGITLVGQLVTLLLIFREARKNKRDKT